MFIVNMLAETVNIPCTVVNRFYAIAVWMVELMIQNMVSFKSVMFFLIAA